MAEKTYILNKKGSISSEDYSHQKGDTLTAAQYDALIERHKEACEEFDPSNKEHAALAEHGVETVTSGVIGEEVNKEETSDEKEAAEPKEKAEPEQGKAEPVEDSEDPEDSEDDAPKAAPAPKARKK